MAPHAEPAEPDASARKERMLGAAGTFTGLWALTWLGSGAAGASVAVQGGFAVGGVMAASGLTVLWWKTRAIKALHPDGERVVSDDLPDESRSG